jgi:hypothetical protein
MVFASLFHSVNPAWVCGAWRAVEERRQTAARGLAGLQTLRKSATEMEGEALRVHAR